MKYIDELLEEINLREEDYEAFQDEQVTDEELQEIKNRVLEEVRKEQIEDEGILKNNQVTDLKNGKRRKKKRWILPLVATLAIGTTLIARVTSGNLDQMFNSIFGENTAYIGESGVELGVSDTQQGITLNVQGIVGDKESAIILFDLTKEDGENFKGNSIGFGELKFQVQEKGVFKGWNPFKFFKKRVKETGSFTSYGWGLIDEVYQKPDKLTFKLDATLDKNLIGSKGVLEVEDVIEVQTGYWDSEVSLVDFFEAHPELLSQSSIPMPEDLLTYTSEEELKYKGYTEDEIKEIMNRLPKKALPSRNLNLDLYPEFQTNCRIDNIGFIDNQLHIRTSGTGRPDYSPGFKDKLDNKIETVYDITKYSNNKGGERVFTGYYVYDIKDIEHLSQLKVSTWFSKKLQITQGKWKVRFKIDIKNQEKIIKTDQTIPGMNHTNLTIKEMAFSNLSLKVIYQGQSMSNIPSVKIKFKDGRKQEVFQHSSIYEENQSECTYAFTEPIDTSQVEAIIINEVEIKVE